MTKKYTKGEDAQDYLENHLGLTDLVCSASVPEEEGGGFSLVLGEPEMVVSLIVMLFKNHPELFAQVMVTVIKVFAEVTPAQMAENAERMEGASCDCGRCKGKATDGTVH